jgi:hypothetical protein
MRRLLLYCNNSSYSVTMTAAEPPKKRLLDRVREAIRLKHYSYRTEETYIRNLAIFDNAATEEDVAIVPDGSLSRRDAKLGFVENQSDSIVS